jgi:hypothetical protein
MKQEDDVDEYDKDDDVSPGGEMNEFGLTVAVWLIVIGIVIGLFYLLANK